MERVRKLILPEFRKGLNHIAFRLAAVEADDTEPVGPARISPLLAEQKQREAIRELTARIRSRETARELDHPGPEGLGHLSLRNFRRVINRLFARVRTIETTDIPGG